MPADRVSFDKQLADHAFELLIGKAAAGWEQHWQGDRAGPNLVVARREIEDAIGRFAIQWASSTDGCFYDPDADLINIPPQRCFVDANEQSATSAYYAVTFHEIVHWTAERVGRPVGAAWFGNEEYAREELVAELGAVMLMEHFGVGIDAPERHAYYFQSWLERAGDREEALQWARIEAEKAVRYILNG